MREISKRSPVQAQSVSHVRETLAKILPRYLFPLLVSFPLAIAAKRLWQIGPFGRVLIGAQDA